MLIVSTGGYKKHYSIQVDSEHRPNFMPIWNRLLTRHIINNINTPVLHRTKLLIIDEGIFKLEVETNDM